MIAAAFNKSVSKPLLGRRFLVPFAEILFF